MKKIIIFLALGLVASLATIAYLAQPILSAPPRVQIFTPWAELLDPENPLPEYPRPQLQRARWQNLNGYWDFTLAAKDAAAPNRFEQRIVVPFPVESSLSGIKQAVTPDQRAWYRRSFIAPTLAANEKLHLHFGAVDWQTWVWLNGELVGEHRGGFDPFFFDIAPFLHEQERQELVIAVWDPTDEGPQPNGKQSLDPGGVFYSAVTGIWQTVWLEPVPESHITSARVTTHLRQRQIRVHAAVANPADDDQLQITVKDKAGEVVHGIFQLTKNNEYLLTLPSVRPWSPTDPHLYDINLSLLREGSAMDTVTSYFGAREISTAKDSNGIWRLFLNGAPLFHYGTLDQGWWPDGLYTAPTDAALRFDIEATKRLGFNTIRKHIKVEPARWYYHADQLGLMVWQDMPTGDIYQSSVRQLWGILRGVPGEDIEFPLTRSRASAAIYWLELDAMLDALAAFTSIVVWVPFNEAWGQFDTDAVQAHTAQRDPSRLVDGPSGHKDTGSGDMLDLHMYSREADMPALPEDRPLVYGEYGGFGHLVPNHSAIEENERGFSYNFIANPEDLIQTYLQQTNTLEKLIAKGLSAAIYTQITDVENELNGLLTYDRRVFKIPPEDISPIHRRLIEAGQPSTQILEYR